MAYFDTKEGTAVNEYLATTKNALFASSTVAASTITADSDGDKYVRKGTVLAKITSGGDSGKVGPYDTDGVTDGRQTASNIVGILDRRLNLRNGDFDGAYLYAGVVKEDRVYSEGTIDNLTSTAKTAMNSEDKHILFR